MKKTRLLTAFMTLALVFSFGACSEKEDTSIEEDDTYITSSSESGNDGPTSTSTAETPIELINKACNLGNYSLLMYVYEWISDPFDEDDIDSGNLSASDVYDTMPTTPDVYIIQAYYTEDALLYALYSEYGYLYEAYLCVNSYSQYYGPIYDYYYTYDLSNWTYVGSGYDYWQEYYWSLFDNPIYFGLTESSLTYYTSAYDSYGDVADVYTYNSSSVASAFGYMCGADIWDYYMVDYLESLDNYVYYYPEYEEMLVYFYGELWYPTDDTYAQYSLYQDQFYSDIYNVGKTNIDSYVNAAEASRY